MRWSTVALGAPLLAGCSLIYNPNNLPDPRVIDAALVDSNACAVQVDAIAPVTIDEGQGDGGSLAALLVLHGNNFVNSNLHVELKAPGGMTIPVMPVSDAMASPDTTYVAFTVTVNADDSFAATVPLDVIVTQDCNATAMLSGQLTLHGLTELTAATLPANTAQLEKKYSKVMLADVTLLGSAAAEINAVSSIDLGNVTASAVGSIGGPGGVSGGVTPGGGSGGGGQGASVSGLGLLGAGGGGGGAGYAADGHAGTSGTGLGGGAGGGAGHQSGDDMLISPTDDRASAGGGGGTGNLSGIAAGGAGGGGGGTVVLTAGGNLTVGSIFASAGAGESRASSGGGGGGGGAGGTVLVSTTNGTLTAGTIHVAGGGAGTPNGGAGAAGRVRWDARDGSGPASPDATAQRGPLVTTKARIVTTLPQSFTAVGTRDRGFTVRVTDQGNVSHDAGHGVFDADGSATITPQLYKGYNKICVTLDGGSPGTTAERCADLAYLP